MFRRRHQRNNAHVLAAGAFGVVAGLAVLVAIGSLTRTRRLLRPEDAPRLALRRGRWRGDMLVGHSVTINRPREEVYARWRDFASFPDFMENVHSVTPLGQIRSRWVVDGPAGSTVEFETKITEDRPNELIAWQSDEDVQVRNSGRIVFRDAPGARGTQVEATITYDPPGGELGRMAAKLFQKEPQIQVRRELRRFKQLMETGEIATASGGAAAPRG